MAQQNAPWLPPPQTRRLSRGTKIALVAGAALLVAVIAVLVFVFVVLPWRASRPIVLPFTGLQSPEAVAVESAGNLYRTLGTKVLKLRAS